MLMFAHGFAVCFNWIVPLKDVDVTMVAPKAPGEIPGVREAFTEGAGTPGLLAVHEDVSEGMRPRCSYRRALSVVPAPGVIETTFAEETETICSASRVGAVRRHERAGQGGLRDADPAGDQPEIADSDLDQPELIVDLTDRGGLQYMRTRSATRRNTAIIPPARAS